MNNADIQNLLDQEEARLTVAPNITLHRYHTKRTGFEDRLMLEFRHELGALWRNWGIVARTPDAIRREVAAEIAAYHAEVGRELAKRVLNR